MAKAYAFSKVDEPLEIAQYCHCGQCIDELVSGVSPRDWAQLEVGYTRDGIQVWCKRHNCNVVHLKWAKDSYE